jgi:methionyl-tRNA formyltransferase
VTAAPLPGGRARTVFIGSGGFGGPTLERLVDHPAVTLVGVVTAPARPAGRRATPTPTVIERAARVRDMGPILAPARLRTSEAVEEVLALRPDLLVLADYGQIVPPALLELPHGALNLHPSLLPRHRGATPIPAAILAADAETGVTLMQMDAGLDSGPIVAQVRRRIEPDVTTPALEALLAEDAAVLLADALGPWLRGELQATPQPPDGATLTRPLRREDGRLDPVRPAIQLERQVRAYQPWPGSFLDTVAGRVVVWRASVAPGEVAPGRFDALGLGTSVGQLRLHEVQPAGGTRMPWVAFVRGRPTILGSDVIGSSSAVAPGA